MAGTGEPRSAEGREETLPRFAIEITRQGWIGPAAGYRREVVSFAQAGRQPFVGVQKLFEDDLDRSLHEQFWQECEARLGRALRSPPA